MWVSFGHIESKWDVCRKNHNPYQIDRSVAIRQVFQPLFCILLYPQFCTFRIHALITCPIFEGRKVNHLQLQILIERATFTGYYISYTELKSPGCQLLELGCFCPAPQETSANFSINLDWHWTGCLKLLTVPSWVDKAGVARHSPTKASSHWFSSHAALSFFLRFVYTT